MAKATEKAKSAPADKAKPEDQAIAKPREPMFSKLGLMIMIGSNVLLAVIVVVLVVLATRGKGEDAQDKSSSPSGIDPKAIWMKMENISVPVVHQGQTVTVRVDLLASFKGEEGDQQDALTHWQSGARDSLMRGWVFDQLKTYDLDAIKDANFQSRFEADLKIRFNNFMKPYEIAQVKVTNLRWN